MDAAGVEAHRASDEHRGVTTVTTFGRYIYHVILNVLFFTFRREIKLLL